MFLFAMINCCQCIHQVLFILHNSDAGVYDMRHAVGSLSFLVFSGLCVGVCVVWCVVWVFQVSGFRFGNSTANNLNPCGRGRKAENFRLCTFHCRVFEAFPRWSGSLRGQITEFAC